ncbi:MAG: hypothetical protein HYZ72_14725, partial [Deltaproteobacteria bacterium]|nr:hypothetical protein [Deltaproteobacteria bacterium]
MALPDFGPLGDLAPGVYRAELHEVLARFGSAVGPRGRCTRDLAHAYELARRTGHLERFLVFGSYVTAKPDPNDVDIILVMIANDEELAVTQQRITQFQSWLAQIRQRARPEEFEGMASGYR